MFITTLSPNCWLCLVLGPAFLALLLCLWYCLVQLCLLSVKCWALSGSYLILMAVPWSECNYYSNFIDQETKTLGGKWGIFPNHTVRWWLSWTRNQLLLTPRLVLFLSFFFNHRAFFHSTISSLPSSSLLRKGIWLFLLVLEHWNVFTGSILGIGYGSI